jgi:cytoskeleton protein RodZ
MPRDERVHEGLAMTLADDGHVDFGTFLRRAREQHGVSLRDLAVTTKISTRVLDALERNDPSKLPGGIFSRAFVRAYAREVGLDPEVAVATFVSAFPNESGADDMPSTTSAVEAESFEQRRRVVKVLARMLGVAVLVALPVFIYYSRVRPGVLPAGPAAVPPLASDAAPEALSAPLHQPPVPESATPVAPGAVSTAGAQGVAAPLSGQAEPAQPPVAAAEPAPVPGAQPGAGLSQQAPLLVVLQLSDACWLSVSVDGTRVPSRTAYAGERIEFAVQRSITMTAGNAGALAITLNGKPARSLGSAGAVVTTTITASGYESFLR